MNTEDAQGMDACMCTMHYVGPFACLSVLASSPPHEPYNTCVWNLGINFPFVKFYLHLPKVFTHVSVKVARKLGAALETVAGENLFSPLVSYLLPLLCLFPLFSSLFSAPLLLVKGKRWHLDCCPASIVSSFLFFMVRGGWYKKRKSEKERTSQKLLCPSFLCSFHLCSLTSTLLPFPLSSCWPSLLFLFFFSFPLFLPAFLLILVCHSLQRMKAFIYPLRQAHAKMVSHGQSMERLPIESARDSEQ